jgi:hypothetical protein
MGFKSSLFEMKNGANFKVDLGNPKGLELEAGRSPRKDQTQP